MIQEVFIDPIRSVLIVDDEFPTLDGFLKHSKSVDKESQKYSKYDKNFERVLNLLDYCRKPDRNWLVDVHDGKGIGTAGGVEPVTHLHQSDLLVLDYKLDGDDADAEKAISILRNLSKNDHFNLVVVYTQDDVRSAFKNIVKSLLTKWNVIGHEPRSTIEKEVHEWGDENESIFNQLTECINEDTYIRLRQRKCIKGIDDCRDDLDVKYFKELISKIPNNIKFKDWKLLKWLLHVVEKKLENQLSPEECGDVTWSADDAEANWIRTNRLFITVVPKKGVPADQLPGKLLDALIAWDPEPPRLIMSKMRTELVARGVNAEDDALSDELIQAIWFLELLQATDAERPTKIASSISRYWEGLRGMVETEVMEYTKKLFVHLHCNTPEPHECLKQHFNVDLQDEGQRRKALLHQNAYNCSKPPEGWHLTTGHILKIDSDYWVCLTPACDLVPGQKDRERFKLLKPTMPFKAVKLHRFGDRRKEDALNNVNSNLCLFIKIESEVLAFQFTAINTLRIANDVRPSETTIVNPHISSPSWEEMFADRDGIFNADSKQLRVARLRWDENTNMPLCEWKDAKIVAQLRYEYALNFLQKLGSTLSRVGLDFVKFEKQQPQGAAPGQANGQADT